MSRELLKRIRQEAILPEDIDDEIQAYLAQPEPEPMAWVSDRGTIWHDKHDAVDDSDGFIQALYTSQPDQSARIAELESQLLNMDKLIQTVQDREDALEQKLAALQARRRPCGECHLQPGEVCDICGATENTK